MTITSAQYIKSLDDSTKNVCVNIVVDGNKISVPLDPNNTDYAEILKHVKAGTLTIKDAD